ncbi:class E sortase [Brevibacterium atlanticum]|uniref:class E sortase n=1 Tax=Brevibacterium atlanticum TaxID=2697563 RepID=UPI001D181881|nr:class E sortase [Brevibacterium atlanticum]
MVNSSSSGNEPGANPPSRPTIRPAQRQHPTVQPGYSADHSPGQPSDHSAYPRPVDSAASGDQPLPSRRELRRREAEAAAAQGQPTAHYSDAPDMYADPMHADPSYSGGESGQATQAMPAAVGGHLGAGSASGPGRQGPPPGRQGPPPSRREQAATRRSRQPVEREPLGPVRGTVRTFGELCITAGLVLILFVVWQLWWTDIEANRDNENLADQLTEDWANQDPNKLPDDPDEPVVADPVDKNQAFGIFYIPRFGDDYYRTVAEGVDLEPVLNRMGVGRYPNSAMPGEVGNFSVAGHRVTYGKPFNKIANLRPGDEIIVQTKDGFYTYTFRNFDIILPDAVEVLSPVPAEPDYKGKDRILTMTACNPMFSARERYVAYAELTDWTPASDGAPDNIKDSKAYDKVSKNGGA